MSEAREARIEREALIRTFYQALNVAGLVPRSHTIVVNAVKTWQTHARHMPFDQYVDRFIYCPPRGTMRDRTDPTGNTAVGNLQRKARRSADV